MAGNITSMLNSGFDAFVNLYDVEILFPTNLPDDAMTPEIVKVRCQDFSFTPLKPVLYKIDYLTSSIQRPGAKFEGERSFNLTFRIDSAYGIFNKFQAWKRLYYDPSGETRITLGALANPEDFTSLGARPNYGMIKVKGYKSSVGTLTDNMDTFTGEENIGAQWEFYQVMAVDVQNPSYSRAGTEAAQFQVQFIFGKYKEPGSTAQ